jgi:hypothetical protein
MSYAVESGYRNKNHGAGVLRSMELIGRTILLVAMTWTLSPYSAAQTEIISQLSSADPKGLCASSEEQLFAGRDGKPIWLDTDALLKRATHCILRPECALLHVKPELRGKSS